jgi:hypothetical protein
MENNFLNLKNATVFKNLKLEYPKSMPEFKLGIYA